LKNGSLVGVESPRKKPPPEVSQVSDASYVPFYLYISIDPKHPISLPLVPSTVILPSLSLSLTLSYDPVSLPHTVTFSLAHLQTESMGWFIPGSSSASSFNHFITNFKKNILINLFYFCSNVKSKKDE